MVQIGTMCYRKVVQWGIFYCVLTTFAQAINNIELEYEILENSPEGTMLGNIITDTNSTSGYNQSVIDQLRFSFANMSEESNIFLLDVSSADLMTGTSIDREELCSGQETCTVFLDITVQPAIYDIAVKVSIHILDVNDNAPMFPEQEIMITIPESTVPGLVRYIPRAIDIDSPALSIQRYDLQSDSDEFRISSDNDNITDLQLILTGALDRELRDYYEMYLIAYDGGTPPRTGSLTIGVTVLDVNDNSPQFESESYSVTIMDDTPVNATIVRVSATDPDANLNGEIRYGFGSSQLFEDHFGINVETGEVYLREVLNYDHLSMYNLTVIARDRGRDPITTPAEVTVNVNVQSGNAHTPVITIITMYQGRTAKIPEGAETGVFVAHITVYDPDAGQNGQVECNTNDTSFMLISLFETEFKIVSERPLDRETQAAYYVQIICTDYGMPQRTGQEVLQVDVEDRNDNPPRFTRPLYSASIRENNDIGDLVLHVAAFDADEGNNADIRYELDVDALNLFAIDHSSGEITAKVRFDREAQERIQFQVFASDNGSPTQEDSATVAIAVSDINDERPRFIQHSFSFAVMENAGSFIDVGQVSAHDRDLEPFNSFTFSIPRGQEASQYFDIDSHTGTISTTRDFDREVHEVFVMDVVVSDDNNRLLNDTAIVTVYVSDMNDNAPIIDFPSSINYTVDISNQVPVDYVVTQILAHDVDTGANAELSYSIFEGNTQGEFVINSTNGIVTATTTFSDIRYHEYELVIMVQDSGKPTGNSKIRLNINVDEIIPYIIPSPSDHSPWDDNDRLNNSSSPNSIGDNSYRQLKIVLICTIPSIVFIAVIIVLAIVFTEQPESSVVESKRPATKIPAGVLRAKSQDECFIVPLTPMPDYSIE